MNFDMRKPCENCPFRRDCLPGWLGRDRAKEIADGMLVQQATFACHKTVEWTDNEGEEDGEPEQLVVNQEEQEHCAGALIMMLKIGQLNQLARIAHRLGYFDPDAMGMTAPVFGSAQAFIKHHTERKKRRGKSTPQE